MSDSDDDWTFSITVPRREGYRAAIYLVLTVALLANPIYLPGTAFDDGAYQYEAARLETDPSTDVLAVDLAENDRHRHIDMANVACDGVGIARECALAYNVLEGEVNVTVALEGIASGAPYRFYYLDGAFHRPVGVETDDGEYRLAFERVPIEDALSELAVPPSRVSSSVRQVFDSGRLRTAEPLDDAGQVVERDGEFLVAHMSASATFSDGFSSCGSEGDGFCDRVEEVRRDASFQSPFLTLLGVGFLIGFLRVVWRVAA